MIKLRIADKTGKILFEKISDHVIDVVYEREYAPGDKIMVSSDYSQYFAVKYEESFAESIVYCPDKSFSYEVCKEYAGLCFCKEAFAGDSHRIYARIPSDEEIYSQRLISRNSHDINTAKGVYPHAYANYVTRSQACFFERNAIDGAIDTAGHGNYPYHSWAGGARNDLEYYLDFGTEVELSKIVFYLRADFPHDTYWKSIDIVLDDDSCYSASFEMTGEGQEFVFDTPVTTRRIHFTKFTQVSEPLSWAALSQIEAYGKYIKKEQKGMEVRNASNSKDVKHYTTERLREEFLITGLFSKDNIKMVYSHIDRIITCGIMPVDQVLKLQAGKELAAEYFLQRREMGVINIGGKGIITVDGTEYVLEPRDGIYIGMGNKDITFAAVDKANPPKFYMSSCPAHKSYPIVKIDITKARKVPCGSVEDCNKRTINQYIHPEVIQSCQLAMGLTQLESGSNWNTMPCHTHDRRMEVYLYLDMDENDAVFHMMGEPTETRHIIMHNEEAVISPSWSIHSGVGTKAYSFIWAMCGENQEFDDMDHIQTKDLR